MYDCRASARSLSLRSCRCVYSQQAIEKLSRLMGLVAALRVRLKLAVAWAVGRPPMSFVVVREQGAKETLTEGGTGTRSRLAGERLGAVQWRELLTTVCGTGRRGDLIPVDPADSESPIGSPRIFFEIALPLPGVEDETQPDNEAN